MPWIPAEALSIERVVRCGARPFRHGQKGHSEPVGPSTLHAIPRRLGRLTVGNSDPHPLA